MPDVDQPRTWPGRLQIEFWTGTGHARAIKGRYSAGFGKKVNWKDAAARDYWGRVVGDPNIYPNVS